MSEEIKPEEPIPVPLPLPEPKREVPSVKNPRRVEGKKGAEAKRIRALMRKKQERKEQKQKGSEL